MLFIRILLLLTLAVMVESPVLWASPGSMIVVPSGATSPNNGNVRVNYNFEIGRNKVTNADFLKFLNAPSSNVGRNGYLGTFQIIDTEGSNAQIKHDGTKFYIVNGMDAVGNPINLSDYPVVHVTWYGAAAYCNWLSREAGFKEVYTKDLGSYHQDFFLDHEVGSVEGYRLGMPAEWLYAARGGKNGQPTRYAGSNNALDIGWFAENTYNAKGASRLYNPVRNTWAGSMPVGKKYPNELGLFDMQGNVFEMLHDRSMYGAPYSSGHMMVNLDSNSRMHAGNQNNVTGFRVFRTAIGQPKQSAASGSSSPFTRIKLPAQPAQPAEGDFSFIPVSGPENLRAAVYGNGRFMIAGNGAVSYISSDGVNWSRSSKIPVMHVVDLAFANGLFIAAGDWGGLATSADGVNWTSRQSGTQRHLTSAYWGSGQYFVTGQGGTLLRSYDGTDWRPVSTGVTSHIMGSGYVNGIHCLITIDGYALSGRDGYYWQKNSVGLGQGTIHGMAAGSNGFVAAASSADGKIFFSADGVNWRQVYKGSKGGFSAVNWDGTKYIVSGLGHVVTSRDGSSWEMVTLPENRPAQKGAADGSTVVVVSSDGKGVFVSQPKTEKPVQPQVIPNRAVMPDKGGQTPPQVMTPPVQTAVNYRQLQIGGIGATSEVYVDLGRAGGGNDTAYFKFTVKKQGTYRVLIYEPGTNGRFSFWLYMDPNFGLEVDPKQGRNNSDYHPAGGQIHARNYTLAPGTYYLKLSNDRNFDALKTNVSVFAYDTRYDSER